MALILTRDEFDSYIEKATNSEIIAVDTEGYFEMDNKLLDVSECVGVSIAGPGWETYLPFRHIIGENLPVEWQQKVINMLNDKPWTIMHNAKHDLRATAKLGIKLQNFYCTMVGTQMVDENIPNKSLDYVSRMSGGMPKQRPAIMQQMIDLKGFGWAYIPVDLMYEYASWDARITYDYFQWWYPQFREQELDGELWGIRQKFIRLIDRMEQTGVRVDTKLATEELEIGEKRLVEISNEIGCNPASPKDLSQLLLVDLSMPVVKRTKNGNPSFDKEAMEQYDEILERLDNPLAKLIKEYRGWSKTVSSNYRPYLERLSSDGRLRCNYNLHRTLTGRLSCDKPNLQQIPRNSPKRWNGKLKRAFIGADGFTLHEGDYSQLEFRLAAAVAKDEALLAIFANPKRDIFTELAATVNMERDPFKTLNYTLQYGGGVNRIKNVFGVTYDVAKKIRDNYYETYPRLRKASLLAAKECERKGYINMWSGRRRHFDQPDKQAHKAFNSWCQGGAADIMERTMIRIDEAGLLDENCRMLLQVHDSVVLEVANGMEDKYLPEFKRLMEAIPEPFGVKFKADVHEWGK